MKEKNGIHKIMCCCGNGVGTSLVMQMTMEEALEKLEITDIELSFGTLSDITKDNGDVFVVTNDLVGNFKNFKIIGLENLMDSDVAAEKLKKIMESE